MTLRVWTARMSYRGDDRLDVTRKSATADGLVWAPSWSALMPALEARREVSELRKIAGGDSGVAGWAAGEAGMLLRESWATYADAYRAEMRRSYLRERDAWARLLAQESATLVCFCDLVAWPGQCHRILLAGILAKCGAVYEGERP